MTIKVWFFGTPALASHVLSDILEDGGVDVWFVVTNPDMPSGRDLMVKKSPVKLLAESHNIPVFTPEKIRNNVSFIHSIRQFSVDYFIVVAYWKILPQEILDIPTAMCINIHGSLLPKYRGASPIQAALLHGEKETGVSIMKMNIGMDEGDILFVETIPIASVETCGTLLEKFALVSGKALLRTLKWLERGIIVPQPQNHHAATYCEKIRKEDGEIDWRLDARTIYHMWQAYTPWPWIYSYYDTKRLLLERVSVSDVSLGEPPGIITTLANNQIGVSCGKWSIILEDVKLEGKKSQSIANFCNGRRDIIWKRLWKENKDFL